MIEQCEVNTNDEQSGATCGGPASMAEWRFLTAEQKLERLRSEARQAKHSLRTMHAELEMLRTALTSHAHLEDGRVVSHPQTYPNHIYVDQTDGWL